MNTTHLEGNPFCPVCFTVCDGVTNPADDHDCRGPITGDFTLCYYCEAVLRFDENMQLVLPEKGVSIPDEIDRMRSYMRVFKITNPQKYNPNPKRIFDLN